MSVMLAIRNLTRRFPARRSLAIDRRERVKARHDQQVGHRALRTCLMQQGAELTALVSLLIEEVRQQRAELMLLRQAVRVPVDQHPIEILEDQVAAPADDQPVNPIAQIGQLVEIGAHRLA